MEKNNSEFNFSLFGGIQCYQLNLFCLMITTADVLTVSIYIYL